MSCATACRVRSCYEVTPLVVEPSAACSRSGGACSLTPEASRSRPLHDETARDIPVCLLGVEPEEHGDGGPGTTKGGSTQRVSAHDW